MSEKRSLGEQIAAIGKAEKVLSGAERATSYPERERLYLLECLKASSATLIWLRDNEAAIREALREKAKGAARA